MYKIRENVMEHIQVGRGTRDLHWDARFRMFETPTSGTKTKKLITLNFSAQTFSTGLHVNTDVARSVIYTGNNLIPFQYQSQRLLLRAHCLAISN